MFNSFFWNKIFEYDFSKINIEGKKKKICTNIFSFDIETTNLIKYEDNLYEGSSYLELSKDIDVEFLSYMYIWQFSIDTDVFYGRTWSDFRKFLDFLESKIPHKKIVFVHNLSFEFQFLVGQFNITDVFARTKRHVIKCRMVDYNIDLRCTLMMSNKSLKKLGEDYLLDFQKLAGDLDYNKIRNSLTPLTEKELMYCIFDCLVVYSYIKFELKTYERVDKIPITQTGHVRRELRKRIEKNYSYKNIVRKAINTDPHIYNLLVEAFAGGHTHANWIFTDEIIKNVDSYDFTSEYPFCMISEKFPAKEFNRCYVKTKDDLLSCFAYLLVVEFTDISCKYYNNIISMSKCRNIRGASYDNGKIIKAKSFEMTLTDIDFKLILDFYNCNYTIKESYFSVYQYLPSEYYNFVLEKYKSKTELKGIEGKEDEYAREKANFNSIFGMSVTNLIRDEVIYENRNWYSRELSNLEILLKLDDEKSKAFLSFAYGVWVTAYARRNLLENVKKLDEYVIYCDTDSIKLRQGYNKKVINDYNNKVVEKLKIIAKRKGIEFENYEPKDIKGKKHLIGLFEKEGKGKFTYNEFITQGAKKYAYKDENDEIHITVSGVPKTGAKALKGDLNNFKDDLVFKHEDTGKNLLIYNDCQSYNVVTDYLGNSEERDDLTGACIVPTTYVLKKSLDYTLALEQMSSKRAKYKEII